MNFDDYYGEESSWFSFYRIPRQLITGEAFRHLSTDAKLLYGLLLDRMGLSARHGWMDEQGRVFIYYTLAEIQEDLGCGHEKAVKLLAELDAEKGCGLIERIKQGQGHPAKIYVKKFTACGASKPSMESKLPPENAYPGSQDFPKEEVQTSESGNFRLPKNGSQDFRKADASYNKYNQTDFSYPDPSIYPSILTSAGQTAPSLCSKRENAGDGIPSGP